MATSNKDFRVKNGLIVGGTGLFNGTVTVATPTANEHAATKQYVDENSGGGGGSLTVGDTPPSNPTEGDLWYNSLEGSTYVYYDSFWVESTSAYAGPAGIVNALAPLSFDEQTSILSIDLSGYATTTQLADKLDASEKGQPDGVATLDENGFVTASQLNVDLSTVKQEINTTLSSNITLQSGYRYFIDTTAARTLTLPATPAVGDEVQLFDASNLAATNNVTVQDGGEKIDGALGAILIDVNAFVVGFVYTGSTYGWRMV